MWTIRARNQNLTLGEGVRFSKLTVVERYNLPDTATVEGSVGALSPILAPGMGALLHDGDGQRTSMVVTDTKRSGAGTAVVTLTSDLVRLWDRIVYPDPTHAWAGQTTDYDVRTGVAETVLLAYVNANAGPGALTARRVNRLTLPATAGRGPSSKTSARFNNLGQLAGALAEAANLRVTVVHDANVGGAGGALLRLTLTDAPNLTAWARYGTGSSGGPGRVGDGWEYTVSAPTVTRAEVAAGGDGAARILQEAASTDAEALWGRRVEVMVDQRQTTDTAEITTAGVQAVTEGAGPSTVTVTILDTPGLRIGSDVPVGAVVQANLDGVVFTERVRQVTTTVAAQQGQATVTVEPVFGSPDAAQTATQQLLTRALKRISTIERER